MAYREKTRAAYLMSRVVIDASGCWLWQGHVMPNGYGTATGGLAHRISYEVFVGPIPEGFTIDHLCRTRRCLRPDHLEAVTQTENSKRAVGPACKRGHEWTEATTYWAVSPGRAPRRSCRTCRALLAKHYRG